MKIKNLLLFFAIVINYNICIAQTPAAKLDTIFNNGSGIKKIELNKTTITNLTNLGMLWGFIKYYHADVCIGKYNMDAQLFRVLPKILKAKTKADANIIMEQWVDNFGVPTPCPNCAPIVKTPYTVQMPDYGNLFVKDNFPTTLQKKLEYIKLNRSINIKHYYVDTIEIQGNPIFTNEYSYSQTDYPDAGIRLLALYRYWNQIQYYFPYRHLIGEDWNKVLAEFIPEFCKAKNDTNYYNTCLKLITRINDSHAYYIQHKDKPLNAILHKVHGKNEADFYTEFIDNHLYVNNYKKDTLGIKDLIKIGDEINTIDGKTVSELQKQADLTVPASNESVKLRQAALLLLRTNNDYLTLNITHENINHTLNVFCLDILGNLIPFFIKRDAAIQSYKILENNIGYINPMNLTMTNFDTVKQALKNTKGIIIDLRYYPYDNSFPYTYCPWFKNKITPFMQSYVINPEIPGLFELRDTMVSGNETGEHYKDKIVLLVNENTQSLGEFSTMAFQTIPGAVTIGSQTAGANGYVSINEFPSRFYGAITGIGIMYMDGTETQRVGVKIDKIVKPTQKGIKEGRDELMEEALKIINGN